MARLCLFVKAFVLAAKSSDLMNTKYLESFNAFRSVAGSDADGKPKLSEDAAH